MKLIGYVDGVEISFDFLPPNHFMAVIPKQLDGSYIVQLKLIDDAGNETSYTDLFICIDFQKMKFKILDDKFKFNQNNNEFGYLEINNKYSIKIL